MSKYDEIVRQLGEFGPYQKRIYLLLCLPGFTHGMRMVFSVFLLFTPKHRCAIPGYSGDTYEVQSPEHLAAIKSYVPFSADGEPESCVLYTSALSRSSNVSYNSSDDVDQAQANPSSTTSCQGWVFDASVMTSTVATDFQLVCERMLMTSHATMVFMFGYLIGVFVLGLVSDLVGRKKSLCVAVVLMLVSGMLLTAATNYYFFVVINFFVGAATAELWVTAFVLGMELVGPRKRVYTGIVIMFFFAAGLLALGGVAWGMRYWRYLNVIITSPVLLYFSFWCLVPESPRWLLQKGRYEEAQAIINKAAKVNGVAAPDIKDGLQENDHEAGCRDNRRGDTDNPSGVAAGRRCALVRQFCSSRVLLLRTSVVWYNWFSVSLVYWSLSFNVGNLGGAGLHVNFLLSSLVEIPAYALCLAFLDRIGRRYLHSLVMLIAAVGCGATLFPVFMVQSADYQWVTVTLAMLGKLGATAAFATVYVFSSELFPTVIRNVGMGSSTMIARIGAMIAPYIANGGKLMGGVMGKAFPLIVCGSLAFTAGLLALLLPETNGQDMPDTVEDLIALGTHARTSHGTPVKASSKTEKEMELSTLNIRL